MWIASANEKYGTNYGILHVKDENGKEIGNLFKVDGDSTTEEWQSVLSEDTMAYEAVYNDELYYPTHNILTGEEGGLGGTFGIWTTSLSAKAIPMDEGVKYDSVVCINYANSAVFGNSYGSITYGLRPVIKILKADFERIENITIE